MLDLNSRVREQVIKRLNEEVIIWFTTVTPGGAPVSNPVWFYWDGTDIVVYSQPGSRRVHNLRSNPKVSLNLQGVDGLGNNVVIIQGEARLSPGNRSIPPQYWGKYRKLLNTMSEEQMIAEYSVEIRIKPLKVRLE